MFLSSYVTGHRYLFFMAFGSYRQQACLGHNEGKAIPGSFSSPFSAVFSLRVRSWKAYLFCLHLPVSLVFLVSSIFVSLPHPLWLPDVPQSHSGFWDGVRERCGWNPRTCTVIWTASIRAFFCLHLFTYLFRKIRAATMTLFITRSIFIQLR